MKAFESEKVTIMENVKKTIWESFMFSVFFMCLLLFFPPDKWQWLHSLGFICFLLIGTNNVITAFSSRLWSFHFLSHNLLFVALLPFICYQVSRGGAFFVSFVGSTFFIKVIWNILTKANKGEINPGQITFYVKNIGTITKKNSPIVTE